MKTTFSISHIVVGALVLLAGVNDSLSKGPHDFTDGEGNDSWFHDKYSCIACHPPAGGLSSGPMWDQEYDVDYLPIYNCDMLEEMNGVPQGITKTCISCHDGTIAETMIYDGSLGGNHSVGVIYDEDMVRDNPRLVDPVFMNLPLYNERLECATCHDPHSEEQGLLRVRNSGSELCYTCHNM